jgi:hypothetical protein
MHCDGSEETAKQTLNFATKIGGHLTISNKQANLSVKAILLITEYFH